MPSFTHYFQNDAFGPLSVEFRVVNLLPGAEIEFALSHRHDHLVVNQQAFQMRIAIGLARAVVPVILPERGEFLEPFIDVSD